MPDLFTRPSACIRQNATCRKTKRFISSHKGRCTASPELFSVLLPVAFTLFFSLACFSPWARWKKRRKRGAFSVQIFLFQHIPCKEAGTGRNNQRYPPEPLSRDPALDIHSIKTKDDIRNGHDDGQYREHLHDNV